MAEVRGLRLEERRETYFCIETCWAGLRLYRGPEETWDCGWGE
jgi:hypothetical protein